MKPALMILAMALFGIPLTAQTEKFEVASVKPCRPSETSGGAGRSAGGRDAAGPTPGRLDLDCMTLRSMIRMAYIGHSEPVPTPIEGGPKWLDSETYSVHAKAEGTPPVATLRGPMLRALLQERFQLKIHHETNEAAVYALNVAKGGPKLTPHREGSCIDVGLVRPLTGPKPSINRGERPVVCGMTDHSEKGPGLFVKGVTLEYFARNFLGIALPDRPVIDRTGIPGLFDIHLDLIPGDDGSSIFSALGQLGLKLEPARGPRQSWMVDAAERPLEN
jgi:uncharacterized protein (TIGR03435 family)